MISMYGHAPGDHPLSPFQWYGGYILNSKSRFKCGPPTPPGSCGLWSGSCGLKSGLARFAPPTPRPQPYGGHLLSSTTGPPQPLTGGPVACGSCEETRFREVCAVSRGFRTCYLNPHCGLCFGSCCLHWGYSGFIIFIEGL